MVIFAVEGNPVKKKRQTAEWGGRFVERNADDVLFFRLCDQQGGGSGNIEIAGQGGFPDNSSQHGCSVRGGRQLPGQEKSFGEKLMVQTKINQDSSFGVIKPAVKFVQGSYDPGKVPLTDLPLKAGFQFEGEHGGVGVFCSAKKFSEWRPLHAKNPRQEPVVIDEIPGNQIMRTCRPKE